jgi:NADH dehydrogenase
MVSDFRRIDPRSARVILIESRDRVLAIYPDDLSLHAREKLERLGVEVMTSVSVTAVADEEIGIGDDVIATRTVLWAAGVQGSPLAKTLGVALDRAGRVVTGPDLSLPGHANVFVIGDLAAIEQEDGSFVPGVAQGAIQSGICAALNIMNVINGRPTNAFRYRDKGSLATIGRGAAVAQVGALRLKGVVAWLFWLVLHIFFLIGFRGRLLVLTQWVWAFATSQRGARLITGGVAPASAGK